MTTETISESITLVLNDVRSLHAAGHVGINFVRRLTRLIDALNVQAAGKPALPQLGEEGASESIDPALDGIERAMRSAAVTELVDRRAINWIEAERAAQQTAGYTHDEWVANVREAAGLDPVMDALQTGGESQSEAANGADVRNAAFTAAIDGSGPVAALLELISTGHGFRGFLELNEEQQMALLHGASIQAHEANCAMERLAGIEQGGA